jgi:hypothetical protein
LDARQRLPDTCGNNTSSAATVRRPSLQLHFGNSLHPPAADKLARTIYFVFAPHCVFLARTRLCCKRLENYFEFARLGTNWRTEILAGVTTFLTMAYIVLVNPAILA